MLERWYPTAHVPSVFAIDYEKLSALGYKGILFDIDNTLVHHGDDSTPEVDALFRHIHSLGLKTLLLSDNSAVRIERFNRNIRTLFIAEAGKPDPAAYRRACAMLGLPPFKIKYEKCEIILCTVDERLKNTGITVMDGPFFSLMPFGQTGLHSLTSVTFTPHETSYDAVATFPCQQQSEGKCRPGSLYNCNECPAKPQSAWPYMSQLARKYLKEEYGFAYQGSLFSMKPILKASEIDDSRPTVVRVMNTEPMLVSVLSGKINTVYDLDEVLNV